MGKTIESAMRMFEAQSVLFAPRMSRLGLLGLELAAATGQQLRVNVWRNHAFEPLALQAALFCAYRGWQADFRLGVYDDTLMFDDRDEADAELLWLDSSRFLAHTGFGDWLQWLGGRLRALRSTTTAPIILATWGEVNEGGVSLQSLADSLPAVYFADLTAVCAEAGVPLLDPRSAKLAGTPLSNAAQLVLAREMACHWLPAVLLQPVKAVALDLDDTLHSGVLGEDGIQGVQLTASHAEFQRYIKSLQQRGIFIALVSRNERPDVEALFAQRRDYPLRWEDFSAIEVSWGDKAAAVERIAMALRIALDAVLFVDNNLGELTSVAMQLPQVHTIFAHPDASLTRHAVHFYPGLWRWKVESDDTKRIQDLKASGQREALAESVTDPSEYFRSLQVTLAYRHDPQEQLSRLADLCSKTNQFNLALRRFTQAEVAERLSRSDACVASVQLTDRLSDSGVIAVVVAERQGQQLVVEELCVSCRAMGRRLENTVILLALRDMPIFAGCREVAFRIRRGPRNQPALDWLARLLGLGEVPVPGLYTLPAQRLLDFVAAEGVSLIKT
jgi:FkbH-like protein